MECSILGNRSNILDISIQNLSEHISMTEKYSTTHFHTSFKSFNAKCKGTNSYYKKYE